MSVRSRLEAAERAKQEPERDFVPPSSRSSLVVGNAPTMSTREHEEMAAAQEPEVLTPPSGSGSSGSFGVANAPLSTREWRERRDALARVNQEQAPQGSPSQRALIDYYADQHKEEVAAREARERAREKEQAERLAREQAAQQKEAERRLWLISVNAAFDTVRATDAERARIMSSPIAVVGNDPNKLAGAVLTLRDALRGKPDWK